MAYDVTREQEARIAEFALNGSSVRVEPPNDDGSVRLFVDGVPLVIDVNGKECSAPADRMYFALPLSTVRAVLGDERVDAALEIVANTGTSNPDHYLGGLLGRAVAEALEAIDVRPARPTHWDKSLGVR